MKTKKTAALGMLLVVSLMLSYVDSLINFFPQIPGAKAGLANIAVCFLLYRYGIKEALIIQILRVFLMSLLFGNASSLIFSLTGAITSLIVMYFVKKTELFRIESVSVTGGVSHNIAQALSAAFIMNSPGIIYYVPVLMIFGVISGLLVGYISKKIIKIIKS